MGYLPTFYLDDIFLIGLSYNECLQNINNTQKLLQSLGFIINFEKSLFQPVKSCKFLGNIIDSKKFEVRLPKKKKKKNLGVKFVTLLIY